MAKSGKITIRLGPREVQSLMEHPPSDADLQLYSRTAILKRVYDAAVQKFPEVAAAKTEMSKAWDIYKVVSDTEEVKALELSAYDRRTALNSSLKEVYDELHTKRAEIVQAALDEAGITQYRAHGYGLESVRIKETGKEEN